MTAHRGAALDPERPVWADYIDSVLAQAPPLSADQRNRLAELLRPAREPNRAP